MAEENRTTVISRIKGLAGKVIETGTHLNAVGLARKVSDELGLSEKWFDYTHVELRNKLNEEQVKQVPFSQRILFLPHCLKKPSGCKTTTTDYGLQCACQKGVCEECMTFRIRNHALGLGYTKVFIVPGGSMVQKLIAKHKPKAVIGLACYTELDLAMDACLKTGLPCQGILLVKSGCNNTEASYEEAVEKIDLIKDSLKSAGLTETMKNPEEQLIEKLK